MDAFLPHYFSFVNTLTQRTSLKLVYRKLWIMIEFHSLPSVANHVYNVDDTVVSNIRFLWEIPEYYEQYLQLGIHQIPQSHIAFDSGLLWDIRLFDKIRWPWFTMWYRCVLIVYCNIIPWYSSIASDVDSTVDFVWKYRIISLFNSGKLTESGSQEFSCFRREPQNAMRLLWPGCCAARSTETHRTVSTMLLRWCTSQLNIYIKSACRWLQVYRYPFFFVS
jgi:hypothetical protein